MVDVDHLGKATEKITAEHLHVLRQHRQVDGVILQQLQHALFRLGLGLPGDRHTLEMDTEAGTQHLKIRMISDHQGDLHRQFTALHPPEQILKTMALPARKNRHPWQLI